MKYNLDGKTFTSVANTENGDVDGTTVFQYHQEGNLVWAIYEGGAVVKGHLIAKVLEDGRLDMRYHHINEQGALMIGTCMSTPELMADGRLKFHETWQWLSGDGSSGQSEIIERNTPA